MTDLAHDVRKMMVLAYPGSHDRTTEILARDYVLEALEDPELVDHVQAQNPPNLDSALRVTRRMEAVFQIVHSRVSKPVRVVSEEKRGPACGDEAKDDWMEQLTKAVQLMDRRLEQMDSREHEVRCNAANYERTAPMEGGLRPGPERVGPDRQNHARDRRCFNCGREGHFAINSNQTRSSGPSRSRKRASRMPIAAGL